MATITFHNGKSKSAAGNGYRGYHSLASMKRAMDYITREDKTEPWLIGSVNCNAATAYEEMVLCKEMYGKAVEDGKNRMIIHFSQHFVPGETNPDEVKEIAEQLLMHPMFDGFQVLYATHTDRAHLHTHFIINTVNLETGLKWEMSTKQMQQLKQYSDSIAESYGLYVVPHNEMKKESYKSQKQIRMEEHGTSWKRETYLAVKVCMETATSRQAFIWSMEQLGYQVEWSQNRKYITFTDEDGHKLRNKKLYPYSKFTKEAMEERFALNKQYQELEKQQQDNEVLDSAYSILRLANSLKKLGGQRGRYPMQYIERSGSEAAKRERMKEAQKGSGLDWER